MRQSTLLALAIAVAIVLFIVSTVRGAEHVGPPAAYPSIPGVATASVTQENIQKTICQPNYTSPANGVRPSSSYTNKLKLEQMATLHLSGKPSDYEEDHFLSLEIGGDPRDPNNLWPEPYGIPYFGARVKDQVEDALHRQVCAGTMTLKAVQSCIMSDWIACGIRLKVKAVTDVWAKYETAGTR